MKRVTRVIVNGAIIEFKSRGLVKIVGLSDATIPRPIGKRDGKCALVVYRGLLKAIAITIRLGQWLGLLSSRLPLVAMDGTGLDTHHASAYYVRRKAKGKDFKQSMTYTRFPKAGIVCDCKSHLILSIVPVRGPGPDFTHFHKAFDQARRRIHFTALAADAGYDAEHIHKYARSRHVRILIPPVNGRPTAKPPSGLLEKNEARLATFALRPALAG